MPCSIKKSAGVVELADTSDLSSDARKGVWVQVPPPAPNTGASGRQLFTVYRTADTYSNFTKRVMEKLSLRFDSAAPQSR